jgi:hypothetical protein
MCNKPNLSFACSTLLLQVLLHRLTPGHQLMLLLQTSTSLRVVVVLFVVLLLYPMLIVTEVRSECRVSQIKQLARGVVFLGLLQRR